VATRQRAECEGRHDADQSYLVFYDERRRAIAWMVEDSYWSIYLYDGTPVAWVVDGAIYSYPGRYLGCIEVISIIRTTIATTDERR
jgi:hypothetical protein